MSTGPKSDPRTETARGFDCEHGRMVEHGEGCATCAPSIVCDNCGTPTHYMLAVPSGKIVRCCGKYRCEVKLRDGVDVSEQRRPTAPDRDEALNNLLSLLDSHLDPSGHFHLSRHELRTARELVTRVREERRRERDEHTDLTRQLLQELTGSAKGHLPSSLPRIARQLREERDALRGRESPTTELCAYEDCTADRSAQCAGHAEQDERELIVRWLRWEADHRPSPTNQRLRDAADAIEARAHHQHPWRTR